MNTKPDVLEWKERLSYSGGSLGSNFMSACISAYLLVYYTNYIHISPGIVGSIMLISKILDAISDIFVGFLIEKTGIPGAKARPWIRNMCLPFIIISIALFCVPSAVSNTGQILYIFITYNIFCTIYTAISVSYRSLNGLITKNQKERERLSLICNIFTALSSMIVNSFTLTLVQKTGNTKFSWTFVISIYAIISGIAYYFCYKNTSERIISNTHNHYVQETLRKKIRVLSNELSYIFRNRYWFLLAVNSFFTTMAISINGGSMYYFLVDVCHKPNSIPIVGLLLSLPVLVLLPLSKLMVNRLGLCNGLCIGYIFMILGRIITGSGSVYGENAIYLGSLIFAIGCSTQWCATPLLLQSIDYGEKKFGVRQDSILIAVGSFLGKCGAALGTAVCGWILQLTNYHHYDTQQPISALYGIHTLYVYLPIILSVFSIFTLCIYKKSIK